MSTITKAPPQIYDVLNEVISSHSRLEQASVGICLTDAKPFRAGRINLGKATKFTASAKIWHGEKKDFCITLCADVWYQILNDSQRKALLDLLLTCCDVEYEPLTQEVNGKEVKVKDEWGRVVYSDKVKCDDEGRPKWRILPLDLYVFAQNAKRYDLWLKDIIDELDNLAVVGDSNDN